MSKLLTFFLLFEFFFLQVFAQNFECINKDKTCFYDNNNVVYATRIDSIIIVNNDTVLFNYKQFFNGEFCLNDKYSWLGREIIKKSNSSYLFVTEQYDTLVIFPNAKIGESWKFQNFVTATVKDEIAQKILEENDSIKIIELSSSDYYWLNGLQIHLSKNFGLVKLFNFSLFPSDSSSFKLIDSDKPHVGVVPMNLNDIYSYQPGDELHITDVFRENYSDIKDVKTIKKVVSTRQSDNLDTINCVFDICKREEIYESAKENGVNKLVNISTNIFKGQIKEAYIQSNDWVIGALPFEMLNESYIVIFKNSYGSYTKSLINSEIATVCDTCDCKYTHIAVDKRKSGILNPTIGRSDDIFIPGLGNSFNEYYFSSQSTREYSYVNTSKIKFGLPKYNCDSLLKITKVNKLTQNKFQLFPNPAKSRFTISISNENRTTNVEICSITGQQLIKEYVHSGLAEINIQSISKGIYVVRVFDHETFLGQKLLIVQ